MESDVMNKFEFLLGEWNLDYRIPKSIYNPGGTDKGFGSFKKELNGNYVIFEYSTESGSEAKGIFVWDDKLKLYKYFWFENSGSFLNASCNFISDEVLALNWHDTLLVQTFVKESPDRVVLKMQHPAVQEKYDLLLEVILTRKK